jgi:hypothetical protein
MHWVLQSNLFNEEGWNRLVETLQRFNIPYSEHKIVPFVGELLPDIEPDGRVICMGSYSMRHIAKKRGWYPGVFDLEPFDFNVQMQHWKDHMLNADAVVSRFEDVVFIEDEMFIRPIQDSKVFAGGVFEREDFKGWQTRICVLRHDTGTTISPDTLVQVCRLKKIYSEHRFWIVKGEIVTASTYKIGNKIHYADSVDEQFYEYVRERVAEWQPLEAFVIDVADTSDGIKIVEINTLNSSGYYAGDMQKLVMALENAFGE